MNSLAHYLEALADPMAHAATLRAELAFVLRHLNADAFGRILCVPVRGEAPDALVRLLASVPAPEAGPVLTILVLAGQSGEAPARGIANARLEAWFEKSLERIGPVADLRRYYRAQSGAVLTVDRHGPGRRFAAGEAHAGARKLAADLALRIWYEGLVVGEWLSSLDPDVILPHDFFRQGEGTGQDAVALAHDCRVLGAEHHVPAADANALCSLAASLSVRFEAYAQAGGWPKRDTGDIRLFLSELELLGRVVDVEGEALLKAQALADNVGTRTGRSLDAAAPRRAALPR